MNPLRSIHQRPSAYVLAALVVGLTLSCTGRAVAVLARPNASQVSFNLVAGANSAPITPPSNTPVHVMGICNTEFVRGVGYVALLRIPGQLLQWTGQNSIPAGTLTSGFTGTPGTAIAQIDFDAEVYLEVNNADSFRVHNGNPGANRAGSVTMLW